MTRIGHILFFAAALLAQGAGAGESIGGAGLRVRGTEARLPVYASTNAPLEAAGWLPGNTVLTVPGTLGEGPWVSVAAPDELNVWVYRELVREGRIAADKSQVRAGAGLAFPPVASLDRGAPVEVRGVFGDWLKIKPPPGVRFWVLRGQVEPFEETPQPPRGLYTALIDALTNDAPAEAAAAVEPPPELAGYRLDGAAAQGAFVVLSGTLDWGGVDAVTAPFRIVTRDANGDTIPLGNLLAPELTYGPHIGERVTVDGTRWQVKGVGLPFIVPIRVQLLGE
ncbi:MAG: SH3 domain-containing protein [Verrucomicrobiota bacterium]|nr:SH3 domain-containing protein [Verrucomicrobiota bacterium]